MKRKRFENEVILKSLKDKKDILKKYGVKRIGLFGSYTKGLQKRNSDIDLVVEFEKPSFDNFMELTFYLEKLFGRKVDILTPDGVKSIRVKKVAEDIKRSIIYV